MYDVKCKILVSNCMQMLGQKGTKHEKLQQHAQHHTKLISYGEEKMFVSTSP